MGRRRLEIGEVGNINVTKAPNGYRARCWYRAQDGYKYQVDLVRQTKTAARKAVEAEAKQRANINNNDINIYSPLSKLLNLWWDNIEKREQAEELSPRSVDLYRRGYDKVHAELGHLQIRECTTPRLRAWVEKTANGQKSMHSYLRMVLRQTFEIGLQEGVVSSNPASSEAIKPLVVKKKDTTALSEDEVIRLRAQLQKWEEEHVNKPNLDKHGNKVGGKRAVPYICDVVDVMLGTGLRIGETLGLRWEDVDLNATPVTVTVKGALKPRKKTNTKDPNEKSLIWEPKPKTVRGFRTLDVPVWAAGVLHRLYIERNPESEWVFSTANATPRSPSNVRTRLRRVCGTTFEGVTPHTFRRTFLTDVAARYGLETASLAAGHSSVAITDQYYNRPDGVVRGTGAVLDYIGSENKSGEKVGN